MVVLLTIPDENGEPQQVYVKITLDMVWAKQLEMDDKIDKLNTKVYSFAGALIIVVAFLGLTGGITIGG